MAFYSSRVDNDGNEIERRFTARSFASSTSGASIQSLTKSMAQMSLSPRNSRGSRVCRCYVNSAAYIEKEIVTSDSDSDLDDDIQNDVKSYKSSIRSPPTHLAHKITNINNKPSQISIYSPSSSIPKSSSGAVQQPRDYPNNFDSGKNAASVDNKLENNPSGMLATKIKYIDMQPKKHEFSSIDSEIMQPPPSATPSSSFAHKSSTGAIPKGRQKYSNGGMDHSNDCRMDEAFSEVNMLSYDQQLAKDYPQLLSPTTECSDSKQCNHQLGRAEVQDAPINREQKERKNQTEKNFDLVLMSKASRLQVTPKVCARSPPLNPITWIPPDLEAIRYVFKREERKRASELEEQRRQLAEKAWEEWKLHSTSKPDLPTVRGPMSDIFIDPNKWQNNAPSDDDA